MNHDEGDMDFVRRQLKSAVPPSKDTELRADLWPRMLRRLDEQPVSFGWLEGVLMGAIVIAFAIFPELLPAMFYHL